MNSTLEYRVIFASVTTQRLIKKRDLEKVVIIFREQKRLENLNKEDRKLVKFKIYDFLIERANQL